MAEVREIIHRLERTDMLRTIPSGFQEGTIDLSSNDYLSLGARHAEFLPEFLDRFSDASFSSSASRLLSGRQKYHILLEEYLSQLYNKEALLFNSGWHANTGCVAALASAGGTVFLCDRLMHASFMDGIAVSGADYRRFTHNDVAKVALLLEKHHERAERIIVAVESIYSMDGDEAPLRELVALKRRFPKMLLYVDEAHAFGVRGERGLGLSEELNLLDDIDILIGTFGKAAASVGAFVIADSDLKSLFVNTSRPFIFSTALPPVNVAWSLLMTEKIVNMQSTRHHLAELSRRFTQRLSEATGQNIASTSQIIPLLTGDASRALQLTAHLREAGYIALPIRRPTVPPGGERIRFSLAADIRMEQLDGLFATIAKFKNNQ